MKGEFDTASLLFSSVINQYHRIRHITKYHNPSFDSRDSPFGKEQPE